MEIGWLFAVLSKTVMADPNPEMLSSLSQARHGMPPGVLKSKFEPVKVTVPPGRDNITVDEVAWTSCNWRVLSPNSTEDNGNARSLSPIPAKLS
jgi:hypothetical protein